MNPNNPVSTPDRQNIEEIIGKAAEALHKTGSEELTCRIATAGANTQTADYEVNNGVIRFFSIDSRNRVVASYCFRAHQENLAHDPAGWLKVVMDYGPRKLEEKTEMVRVARERSKQYENLKFQVADAMRWEFPQARFDFVCSIATLHHNAAA